MKRILFVRYHESPETILDAHENTDATVLVYDRGVEKLSLPKYDRLLHIEDENYGKECGGYLRFITEHYNQLSDDEILIFSQAQFADHVSGLGHHQPFSNWVNNLSGLPYESYINRLFLCDKNGLPDHRNGLPMSDAWRVLFDTEPPEHYHYYPNAIFATTGATIRKKSLPFYEKLYALLKQPEHNVTKGGLMLPWTLERMWGYIFV